MDAPRVQTAAVVVVGASVVVHRHGIRAPAHHVGVKPNVKPQVVLVVSLRKHLHAHGAAHVAVGGQLRQEHPQVRPRKGVGRRPWDDRPPRPILTVLHKPLPGPKHALPPTRKQHRHPLLAGRRRRRPVEPDRDPTVERQVREKADPRRRNAFRVVVAKRVLVKRILRHQRQRILVVPHRRNHAVRLMRRLHVQPKRSQARQIPVRMLRHHLQPQPISLRRLPLRKDQTRRHQHILALGAHPCRGQHQHRPNPGSPPCAYVQLFHRQTNQTIKDTKIPVTRPASLAVPPVVWAQKKPQAYARGLVERRSEADLQVC